MNCINKAALCIFALAIAANVNETNVSASSYSCTGIELNYNDRMITIKDTKNKRINLSFPTFSKGTLSADKNICTYDMPADKLNVDLSTLNSKKDNYIKVWGDIDTEPIVIKIPAAEVISKAEVNNYSKTITVKRKSDAGKIDYANLEFATNTNWKAMSDFKFDNYLQLGASIQIRGIASSDKTLAVSDKKGVLKDKSGTEYDYYEGGSFASNEIKAKIKKLANGPKVSINYTTGVINMPSKTQYRIISDEADTLGDWVDSTGELKISDTTKFGNIASMGYSLDVRMAANADRKTLYSKYTTVKLNKTYKISTAQMGKDQDMAVLLKLQGSGTDLVAVNVVAQYTLNVSDKGNSGFIEIVNGTKDVYNYVVQNDGSKPDATVKGKALKPTVAGKAQKINLNPKKESVLWLRKAADTENCMWATNWVKVMTISKEDMSYTANIESNGV